MRRIRTVFLAVSVTVVLLFAGLSLADRRVQDDLFRAMGNLAEVVHLVRSDYVDPLDTEALSQSLDAGILESVDPWAAVVPENLAKNPDELVLAPPPYGLVFGLRLGSAAVRSTLAGSPAASAGLEAGEVIEQVEGMYTRGRPLWHLRRELLEREGRGEAVHLTVVDRSVDARREVVLEATPWHPLSPTAETRDGVRVIKLSNLATGTAEALRPMLAGSEPVVLDLRNVVWGQDDEAIRVADLFEGAGLLGEWRGQRAGEHSFPASPEVASPAQTVAIIDGGTEGPGEILAAALGRAKIELVGTGTAGHAPHMSVVSDGGLRLWIPVADWLGADGEAITAHGVQPSQPVTSEGADKVDAALQRALELVRTAHDKAA